MFTEYSEESRIIRPTETQPVTVTTRIRIDPLTKHTVRITPRRTDDPPIDFSNPPYREHVAESGPTCPFCPGRIGETTPRFPPEICGEGRFVFAGSILFPNLFPYGRHSAVAVFSPAHFIEIGEFTGNEYRDAFINARGYIERVFTIDPEVRFSAVTQNYLPSSGGTLIHPHLQINIFVTPTNYLRELSDCSARYHTETGRSFWDDLVQKEEALGGRWIARTGPIAWFTPFAPQGQKEVWAVFEGRSDFREITDNELAILSGGIVSVQRYYRDTGNNSFNLGAYSIAGQDSDYRLLVRMVVRTKYIPYARNDQSYFEVILGEAATDEFPEKIASDLKKYLDSY